MGPGYPDIRLKLENLQPANSYKLRGAVNAMAMLAPDERARGVWTISSGNAGQGIAYAARQFGVTCTVVVVETAPAAKIERMKEYGARVIPVPYAVVRKALNERAFAGVEGTFVHPFDDHNFIAGHATLGLEILEDTPDVGAVIAAVGGGGLVVAVGSSIKALRPTCRVFGVEPETAAPVTLSFGVGSPQEFKDWTASFVEGAGGMSLFPRMWQRMQPIVDGCVAVSLDETRSAMRILAEQIRIISEGAAALPLAAILGGKIGESDVRGPIVAVVSGGNIDLPKFFGLIGA